MYRFIIFLAVVVFGSFFSFASIGNTAGLVVADKSGTPPITEKQTKDNNDQFVNGESLTLTIEEFEKLFKSMNLYVQDSDVWPRDIAIIGDDTNEETERRTNKKKLSLIEERLFVLQADIQTCVNIVKIQRDVVDDNYEWAIQCNQLAKEYLGLIKERDELSRKTH